eukprot:TRINITY_DN17149_c0_g1_i1.p1 TRINITY_DN17149_c0_g1~~TRINITY_DN17149_c0_g1_i1.p1  ORF type:complete len:481 (+),score=103.96 TRINITY_DN17149_c0_g1_i1:43-1485(+)
MHVFTACCLGARLDDEARSSRPHLVGIARPRSTTYLQASFMLMAFFDRDSFQEMVRQYPEMLYSFSAHCSQYSGSLLMQQLIDRLGFFEESPSRQQIIERLASRLVQRSISPEHVVFEQGDKGESMFFVLHGTLDVFRHSRGKVAELVDGAHFGELSLLSDTSQRTATVKARSTCLLAELHRLDFEAVMEDFPDEVMRFVVNAAQMQTRNKKKDERLQRISSEVRKMSTGSDGSDAAAGTPSSPRGSSSAAVGRSGKKSADPGNQPSCRVKFSDAISTGLDADGAELRSPSAPRPDRVPLPSRLSWRSARCCEPGGSKAPAVVIRKGSPAFSVPSIRIQHVDDLQPASSKGGDKGECGRPPQAGRSRSCSPAPVSRAHIHAAGTGEAAEEAAVPEEAMQRRLLPKLRQLISEEYSRVQGSDYARSLAPHSPTVLRGASQDARSPDRGRGGDEDADHSRFRDGEGAGRSSRSTSLSRQNTW